MDVGQVKDINDCWAGTYFTCRFCCNIMKTNEGIIPVCYIFVFHADKLFYHLVNGVIKCLYILRDV